MFQVSRYSNFQRPARGNANGTLAVICGGAFGSIAAQKAHARR